MAAIESYVTLVLFFFGGVVAVLFRFCSPCQVAPSQSAGMKKLQQLKEILVEEGRERVQQELQGVPRNVMREVCKAAQLSVAAPTGQTFVVAELRSAVLAHLLNQSDEPDEAGCVKSWFNGTLLHVLRGQIARMNISFCASDRSALEFDEYIFLLVAWFMSAKIQHQDQCVF